VADYEVYQARADGQRALELAATTSPFMIEVQFIGGLTQRQQEAFAAAADRWVRVIVGDLPEMLVGGEVIDDVVISAQGRPIDGIGTILGQAGPVALRPAEAGAAAFLPATGSMFFDTADLARMEADGRLNDVITHEMGHVLGIGTIWDDKGLLKDAGTDNPVFIGAGAMQEYRVLRGGEDLRPVPVANEGGAGSRDSHWREKVFVNELMTPEIGSAGNPLSRMSVASLGDLGYQVDLAEADAYVLPDLLALAEAGELLQRGSPIDEGIMLPIIPFVLPPESLQTGRRA
jgi:Leishmanolysin